jgi:hypothetical protein
LFTYHNDYFFEAHYTDKLEIDEEDEDELEIAERTRPRRF